MNIMEIENLSIDYGNKKIIKSLDMKIERNKIISIIGPSGCGKTTFLTSLNRMLEENGGRIKGSIKLEGRDIYEYKVDSLRRSIGMVFQNPTPFPLSIYDNLKYALDYYGVKNKRELDNKIVEVLKLVGLYEEVEGDLKEKAQNLSGGQQQRLCIARALSVNPKIILLDEPCSALDVKSTETIEKMLMNLSSDYTIIIVTHNLAQAKRISDYTAFFLEGRLIEYDSTKTIFNSPRSKLTKEYVEGIYG